MKAIILAAGRGSRMEKGTESKPKCLTTLFGRTLLDHCIDSLKKAGYKLCDIGIVTGYKKEQVNIEGATYFHNDDWENTNVFVSLTMTRNWLANYPCVVVYSDIFYCPSVIDLLVQAKEDIAITYYTEFWKLWTMRFDDPLSDLETFILQGGKLAEIGKKPKCKSQVMGQFMGILRFTPKGWEKVEESLEKPLPKPVSKLDMTTLLQHLLSLGCHIEAIPTSELWLECDNLNDVMLYEQHFNPNRQAKP